jgi:dolichyl-phosphate beta-glucosyltransferase
MRVGIIIPAYNEKDRISPTLEAYGKYFTDRSEIWNDTNFQILISINGTTDNTQQLVTEIMKKYPIISYINNPEPGKGLAVKRGFDHFLKQGDRDYIGFVDSDMSTTPEEYFKLILNCFISNKNVTANRYDKESKLTPPPGWKRTLMSRVFNAIVRIMFPSIQMRDTQCGAKVFLVRDLNIVVPLMECTNWGFDCELIYLLLKNNCRIVEFPTQWESKDYSKVTLGGTSLKMLFSLIRLRISNSPFKSFIKLYNRIPEKYKFHHYV